jgi:hypothetical protein
MAGVARFRSEGSAPFRGRPYVRGERAALRGSPAPIYLSFPLHGRRVRVFALDPIR